MTVAKERSWSVSCASGLPTLALEDAESAHNGYGCEWMRTIQRLAPVAESRGCRRWSKLESRVFVRSEGRVEIAGPSGRREKLVRLRELVSDLASVS